LREDEQGALYVNGDRVEDPWSGEYGEQMPMAVIRLGARAAAAPDGTVCLQVDLPGVIVRGVIDLCGPAVADRMAPLETPPPSEPEPTMPPTYGEPSIDGAHIPDRLLDVNSYPLLDIADVENVPACFRVQADANDVHATLSLALCMAARWDAADNLTLIAGDEEWTFAPEDVYDESGALIVDDTVEVGLEIVNHKDDVIHLIEMAVWVTPDCPG
jgi:hypothetical protein